MVRDSELDGFIIYSWQHWVLSLRVFSLGKQVLYHLSCVPAAKTTAPS
jgi:hypothetical protein